MDDIDPHRLRQDKPIPLFGDIEASGLDRDSYPIEVAWSLPGGDIKSRLIRRETDWVYWDDISEDIHGIRLADLEVEGRPARDVAKELNSDLSGKVLHFDGGVFDRFWLARLFDAAGLEPSFEFGDYDHLLTTIVPIRGRERTIGQAKAKVIAAATSIHRAGDDVRLMQQLYDLLKAGIRDR